MWLNMPLNSIVWKKLFMDGEMLMDGAHVHPGTGGESEHLSRLIAYFNS